MSENQVLNTNPKKEYQDLTARQEQILDYLKTYILKHGFAPSVREIGKCVNLNSPSAVQNQLDKLEEKGYIRRTKGRHRMIEVPDMEKEVLNIRLDRQTMHQLRMYCARTKLTEDTLVDSILRASLPKEKKDKRKNYA